MNGAFTNTMQTLPGRAPVIRYPILDLQARPCVYLGVLPECIAVRIAGVDDVEAAGGDAERADEAAPHDGPQVEADFDVPARGRCARSPVLGARTRAA